MGIQAGVEELFDYMSRIPSCTTLFASVASAVLSLFQQRCQSKYDELTEGSEMGRLMRAGALAELQSGSPAWRAVCRAEGSLQYGGLSLDAESFWEQESRLESTLQPRIAELRPLDLQRLSVLAYISDSCDWVAAKVERVGHERSLDAVVSAAKAIRSLSERTLWSVRVELRSHAIFQLDAIKRGVYAGEQAPSEPDPAVSELCRVLSACDENLTSALPPLRRKYVFEGLPRLLGALLIRLLPDIPRIDHNGVLKMSKNVFALQQNLSTHVGAREAVHLDRVRK
jgi:exocyst complex component 4